MKNQALDREELCIQSMSMGLGQAPVVICKL